MSAKAQQYNYNTILILIIDIKSISSDQYKSPVIPLISNKQTLLYQFNIQLVIILIYYNNMNITKIKSVLEKIL